MSDTTVYTIRRKKYASQLTASGVANRWNKTNQYVIYAGSSIALSTLEFFVHRANINIENSYQILSIAIKNSEEQVIKPHDLPKNWRSINAYSYSQEIGSNWYEGCESLTMKVPSAVVPQEYNFLINTLHPQFTSRVKIINREEFIWDHRLLEF